MFILRLTHSVSNWLMASLKPGVFSSVTLSTTPSVKGLTNDNKRSVVKVKLWLHENTM